MTSSLADFPPEYVNEKNYTSCLVVAIASIILEIAVVALRFYTRKAYKTQWGFDDYLTVPALMFCLGVCIITIIEVKIAGVGRHMAVLMDSDPQALVNWGKYEYALECVYCASIAFPKLSILASYLRIFVTKPYRIATYVLILLVLANPVNGIIASLSLSCHPFSARWDPDLFVSNCSSAQQFWIRVDIPNIVTDVAMLALPLPLVWHLQMDLRRRLALCGVFLLGSVGMIASAVRLSFTVRLSRLQDDGTWYTADIGTWSCVESASYLIAASLPIFNPHYVNGLNWVKTTAKRLTAHALSPGKSESNHIRLDNNESQSGFVRIEVEWRQKISPSEGTRMYEQSYYIGSGDTPDNPTSSINSPGGIGYGR